MRAFLPKVGLVAALVFLGFKVGACALTVEVMQSLILVEGDDGRGRGSAFIVKMNGKTYLVTNAHVVQGQVKSKFKNLSNEILSVGPFEIADAADLVRAELKGERAGLETLPQIEQNLQIGEEVVVAGNSEGAGVIRELAGKITGLGPDRIEVDATFVPGNSGSPILLRRTGQVIGVATYLHTPYFFRKPKSGSGKKDEPILSLNEVRRFGYRLDTVAHWIAPALPAGITAEGLKLDDVAAMDTAVKSVAFAGTSAVAGLGGEAFVRRELQEKSIHFRNLAAAIDDFSSHYRAAKQPEEKREPFLKLFQQLKEATIEDVRETRQENFSGYFAKLFEQKLEHRKGLRDWLDSQIRQAEKNSWTLGAPWSRDDATAVDVSKINLVLTDRIDPAATVDTRHVISYLPESKPSSLKNVYWVIENPAKKTRAVEMRSNNLSVATPMNGSYQVSVEYRAGEVKRKISNVVEFSVADIPAPNVEVDFEQAAPLTIAADESATLPDWQELARRISGKAYVKTRIIGQDSNTRIIRDLPESGAVLVGFDCVLAPYKRSNETVHGLRPVFLAKSGIVGGTSWGDRKGNSTFRLIAKPGYAVGKVTGQFDTVALRCLKVRFDRMHGLKLDPRDSYESAWIGLFADAEEVSAETNGRLAVGIVGKHGGGLDGFRLVCLADALPNAIAPSAPVAINATPKAFGSLAEILNVAPESLWVNVDDPATRKAAVQEINKSLTANARTKPVTLRIRVERTEEVQGGGNRFRIKTPDHRIPGTRELKTRLWVYFPTETAPKRPVQPGSEISIRGVIGRCELSSGKNAQFNLDVQGAQQIEAPELVVPGAISRDRDSGVRRE